LDETNTFTDSKYSSSVPIVSFQLGVGIKGDAYFAPQKAFVLRDGPVDPERHTLEPPEGSYDRTRADREGDPFCNQSEAPRREDEMVEHVREHQHGKVEGWELRLIRLSVLVKSTP
jgi:hypothetical protein